MASMSKTPGTKAAKTKPKSKPAGKDTESATRLFKNQSAWTAWLEKNYRSSGGIWLRLAKKNSGLQSVSYAEALEADLD